jgi:plasmid replication initiation protein
METTLTKQNYGRQSHFLINAKYTLTRGEIDLILALLTVIKKDDKDFKDYIFDIEELEHKFSRKLNSQQLQNSVEKIFSKSLKIEISKNRWKMFNWFSYFEYNNGLITCRFDKDLKPYLLEIKERFVISDLRMILPMRSSYSKRIYLLLKEYAKIGERTFTIKKLQEILVVPTSHRERYNKFKVSVLQKAETDINKFTDLEVKLSEKKRAKKVVEITYTIKKNHTDLKTFISIIREVYTEKILHFSKDNRPIICNKKGFLYYGDDEKKAYIDQKEAQNLWEYLHENRENLYIFKKNSEENMRYAYTSSMSMFQEYLKEKFVHKKIARLKKGDDSFDISIFPNGRLYDMSGESLSEDAVVQIWKMLYKMGKEGKLDVFEGVS